MFSQEEMIENCKKKQFDILCYISDVCAQNDISVFLAGETALAAYRNEGLVDDTSVCIEARDAVRLIEALGRTDSKYVVDSMYTNGDFPIFEIRVYDPDTVDFITAKYKQYRYNSLFVRVLLLQHMPVSPVKTRLLSSLYTAYKKAGLLRAGGASPTRGRMLAVIRSMEKKRGIDGTGRWVFEKMIKGYSGSGKKCVINMKYTDRRTAEPVSYDYSTIFPLKKVTYMGREFFLPGKPEKYLNGAFVKNWRRVDISAYIETKDRFRDPDHSWEEFKNRISYMDFDKYNRELREFNEKTLVYNEYHKKVKEYRDILARTDARFKLWQRYMPLKDQLKQLWEQKDYMALEAELREYLDQMKEFADKELGLCFDPEIMEIALDVLEHKGDSARAKLYRKLVPAEHRGPLKIMNYKGEYVN